MPLARRGPRHLPRPLCCPTPTARRGHRRRRHGVTRTCKGYSRAMTTWTRRLRRPTAFGERRYFAEEELAEAAAKLKGKPRQLFRGPFKGSAPRPIPWGTHELVGESGRDGLRGKRHHRGSAERKIPALTPEGRRDSRRSSKRLSVLRHLRPRGRTLTSTSVASRAAWRLHTPLELRQRDADCRRPDS
jgi:hypothetical protein